MYKFVSLFSSAQLIFKDESRGSFLGFILPTIIPFLIALIIVFVWRINNTIPKDIHFLYVVSGYIAWDFYARLILDGTKFFKKNSRIFLNENIESNRIILINFIVIFFRFLLSISFLMLVYFFYFFDFLFFVKYFWIILYSFFIGLVSFYITIYITHAFPFTRAFTIYYCRLGIFLTPIFWMAPSKDYFVYFTPGAYFIQNIRYVFDQNISSYSIFISMIFLFIGLFIFSTFLKNKNLLTKIIIKNILKYG